MDLRKIMLSSQHVETLIIQSLRLRKPLSLIRINDGENRALGYKLFVTKKQLPRWFRYTGVEQPSEKVRSALIKSIKEADIVGFPTQDNPLFRPLSEKIISYYKLQPKHICNGIVNRFLLKNGGLERIIRGRKIILVGLTIGEASSAFKKMGGEIVGIEKVKGFDDIPRVMKQIAQYPEFDLALVSAGIPAKILCNQISKRFGKVALDMGHIPELILYPNMRYGQIMKDWLVKHPPMTARVRKGKENTLPRQNPLHRVTKRRNKATNNPVSEIRIRLKGSINLNPSPPNDAQRRFRQQNKKKVLKPILVGRPIKDRRGEKISNEVYQPHRLY